MVSGIEEVDVDMVPDGVVAIEGVVSIVPPVGVVDMDVVLVVSVEVVSRFWHPLASATANARKAIAEISLRVEVIGVPPGKK